MTQNVKMYIKQPIYSIAQLVTMNMKNENFHFFLLNQIFSWSTSVSRK